MAKAAHDEQGRFTVGNPGGPERPRRPVEREYLQALNEAVSLNDWKEVVRGALAQAKEGDAKAREWLAKYLLGNDPPSLLDLAADDVAGTGIFNDLLKALTRYARDIRERRMFEAEDLAEAGRLLQRDLARDQHDGQDGGDPSP